jgi:hypothetical protein
MERPNTPFKSGALISLPSYLKQCGIDMIALHATRWQGKYIMDITHTHFYSGKVKRTRDFGVAFEVVRTMNRNVRDF